MLRRYFPLVIGLLACLGSGCADVSEVREPVELQAPTASVPVVYDERLRPARLTSQQMDGILSEAIPLCPPGQRVWFIWVHYNKEGDQRPRCNATVYFTPEVRGARIRKGMYVLFEQSTSEEGAGLVELTEIGEGGPLFSYYQVSFPDKPFGDDLDVPPEALMPFEPPEGLSDEEAVEVVDFIRSDPEIRADTQGDPISSIGKEDDSIYVSIGKWQHPLAASHHVYELKRTPGGFTIVRSFSVLS